MEQIPSSTSENRRAQEGGAGTTETVFRPRRPRWFLAVSTTFAVVGAAALVGLLLLGDKEHRLPPIFFVGCFLAVCFFSLLPLCLRRAGLVVSDRGVGAGGGLLRWEVAWSDVTSFEFSEGGQIVLRRCRGKPLHIALEYYEDADAILEKLVAVLGDPKPVKEIDLLSRSERGKGLVLLLACSVPLILFSSVVAWAAGVGTGTLCAALGLRRMPTTLRGIRRRRAAFGLLVPGIIGFIVGMLAHGRGDSVWGAVLVAWSFIVGAMVGQFGLHCYLLWRRQGSSTKNMTTPGSDAEPGQRHGL